MPTGKKSGGIVYAAILSNMVFGRCLALLYVSAEEEEWELDREDLDGGFHLRMWRTWMHWIVPNWEVSELHLQTVVWQEQSRRWRDAGV